MKEVNLYQKFWINNFSYVKIIHTDEEIAEWRRLIIHLYQFDEKIMDTLESDMEEIRQRKMIAVGYYIRDNKGKYVLITTQATKKQQTLDFLNKVIFSYDMHDMNYDEMLYFIDKIGPQPVLYEITRTARYKDYKSEISVMSQIEYIVGLIRCFIIKNSQSASYPVVSVTSKLHAKRYSKFFKSLISDSLQPIHMKSKQGDLQISIVYYDQYMYQDNILLFFKDYSSTQKGINYLQNLVK